MRIFLLFSFAFYFYNCLAQDKEVTRIDVNLDISVLKIRGGDLGRGRVLPVDTNYAIGQFASVDIVLFNMKSGQIIKSIDTAIILESCEEHLNCLLGSQYYVPEMKEMSRSVYNGGTFNFRGLMYLEEKERFVTNMVTVAFNREDESAKLLFLSLVFFDKNLENIEIIPFDPFNMSSISGWIHGGFFLGHDRVFTKMLAWEHGHDHDFHEYRLTDDNIYTLTDSLSGVKTSTLGYIGRFHGCYSFNAKNYINLGSMLYAFEDNRIKEGTFVQFPQKTERNYVYIVPIDQYHLIAYVINNFSSDPNPTGWLLMLDKDLVILREIHAYDLREVVFCSLFTFGNSVYLANYSTKNENYFLLKYDF